MRIRVAICTQDVRYSEKLVKYFQKYYYDKFVWNVFTEFSYLVRFFQENDADIVLIDEKMQGEAEAAAAENARKDCVWACLADDPDGEGPAGLAQLRRYSRGDRIYRDLLELYSHKMNAHFQSETMLDDKTSIYVFASASGGAGVSTLACAVAQHFAKYEKVLYIDMENIGVTGPVFGEGSETGFDDVLFALKSRRSVLELKLSSAVSRGENGVYFFKVCENVPDIMELTGEDLKELLSAIRRMREYDKVILDVGNGLGDKEIAAMAYAGRTVIVMENGGIAPDKFARYLKTIRMFEEGRKTDICSKFVVFYNRILQQARLPEQVDGVKVMGGIPRLENGSYREVIDRIAGMEVLQNIR